MPEPRYLMGDEYALNGAELDIVKCKECASEYDYAQYRSYTCSDCEDKQVNKNCDCDNLDQDVEGYTCYKCYEKGE